MSGFISYLSFFSGSKTPASSTSTATDPLLVANSQKKAIASDDKVNISVQEAAQAIVITMESEVIKRERTRAIDGYGRFSALLFTALSISSLAFLVLGDTNTETRYKAVFIGSCAIAVTVREGVGYYYRHGRLETPRWNNINAAFLAADVCISCYSIILGVKYDDPLPIAYGSLIGARACVPYSRMISACTKIQRAFCGSK